ncbi:TPA: hypothetical protein DEP96_03105 [Candidatus Uhrbacteria bacterium]|nr:hypothetical protein [Candidatus Uhrbacteria bacterium]
MFGAMEWIAEFLLAPLLVGVAVFIGQLAFSYYQLPKPSLKLKATDTRTINQVTLTFFLVNEGRTALHTPLLNLDLGSVSLISGDFIVGHSGRLIYKHANPLLPGGIGLVLHLTINGEIPQIINYIIQGEEKRHTGKIDIEQWNRETKEVN